MADKKSKRRVATLGRAKPARARNRGGKPEVREIASTRPVGRIKSRVSTPTRALDPSHVVALAESIHALGLIEPIVLDADDHLLAGAHRLAACRVLAAPDGPRTAALLAGMRELSIGAEPPSTGPGVGALSAIPDGPGELTAVAVPVRVFAIRSSEDQQTALAIEATENEKRRDYSKQEVLGLWNRLEAAGYRTKPGKQKRGQKPELPLMKAIIGKSERHIKRMVKADEGGNDKGTYVPLSEPKDRAHLRQSAQRYLSRHAGEADAKTKELVEALLNHLDAK